MTPDKSGIDHKLRKWQNWAHHDFSAGLKTQKLENDSSSLMFREQKMYDVHFLITWIEVHTIKAKKRNKCLNIFPSVEARVNKELFSPWKKKNIRRGFHFHITTDCRVDASPDSNQKQSSRAKTNTRQHEIVEISTSSSKVGILCFNNPKLCTLH